MENDDNTIDVSKLNPGVYRSDILEAMAAYHAGEPEGLQVGRVEFGPEQRAALEKALQWYEINNLYGIDPEANPDPRNSDLDTLRAQNALYQTVLSCILGELKAAMRQHELSVCERQIWHLAQKALEGNE